MNKLLYILLLVFVFTSCDSFLEEKSQDLIIPKTVKEYSEFLFGEGYIRDNVNVHTYLDIMTDDVAEKNSPFPFMQKDIREDGAGYFTWQKSPEYSETKYTADDAWDTYYSKILIANNIIEMIDEAEGSDNEKKDLKAEAYFLRAYSYFMLVNIYGEPYVKETAEKDLGVPINLKHIVQDAEFERESVARVYKQVDDDLKASIALFSETQIDKTVFRASIGAAYFLAARVSLYKKEYKDVITHVEDALRYKSVLYNIANMESGDVVISKANPELIWTYGNYDVPLINGGAYKGCFPPSAELYKLYSDKDGRRGKYIIEDWGDFISKKNDINTGVYGFGFRTAELYLNRAEANAELGNLDLAKDDIKRLRKFRYTEEVEITAEKQGDVIDLVRKEHRLEFCFEQHRWFDLRRWGMPSIEHTYTTVNDGVKTFTLEKGDKAYTLPLPATVKEFDFKLKDIDRPVRDGVN